MYCIYVLYMLVQPNVCGVVEQEYKFKHNVFFLRRVTFVRDLVKRIRHLQELVCLVIRVTVDYPFMSHG